MRDAARILLLGGWLLGAIVIFLENQFSSDLLLRPSSVLTGGLIMLGAAAGFLVLAFDSYYESRKQYAERTQKFFNKLRADNSR